jgi:hypothetical protein
VVYPGVDDGLGGLQDLDDEMRGPLARPPKPREAVVSLLCGDQFEFTCPDGKNTLASDMLPRAMAGFKLPAEVRVLSWTRVKCVCVCVRARARWVVCGMYGVVVVGERNVSMCLCGCHLTHCACHTAELAILFTRTITFTGD